MSSVDQVEGIALGTMRQEEVFCGDQEVSSLSSILPPIDMGSQSKEAELLPAWSSTRKRGKGASPYSIFGHVSVRCSSCLTKSCSDREQGFEQASRTIFLYCRP